MAPVNRSTLSPYDALLVCSFGGPNRPDEVMPFLRNVTAGKGVPDERLADVAEHYALFGGRSPINALNLELVAAITHELDKRHIQLPVLWGNRNWHPYTADTLRDARAFGARRILTIITSAYASYSGRRQYREHLAAALADLGAPRLQLDIVRPYFNEPGFVEANYQAIVTAAENLPGGLDGAHIAYVTHSIPTTMQVASAATGPGYQQQHEDVASVLDAMIAGRAQAQTTSSLSYCSRSGDPHTPWLEPDINDELGALAERGIRKVVIAPIGFVADHMEVVFDLDTEARATADSLGVSVARAATAGTHPAFVSGLVDLIVERADRERGVVTGSSVVGAFPPFADVAPPGSCRQRADEVTGIPVIAGTTD